MKKYSLSTTVPLLLALCLAACDTVEREHTLSAAGFRTIVPRTAEQRNQLLSLPADRVTPLRNGNQTVFIFPDPKRDLLFVGREANYQQYRRLRLEQRVAEENLSAAQMWSDPGWRTWGPWPGYWW